ncbi:MAG TPA: hypothetical protein VGM11_11285 [Acidobacteriaceae bacterium]
MLSCFATLAALVLAGCSSGGSGSGQKTSPPPPTSPYTATSVLLLTQSAIYTYPLSGDGTPATINVTPSSTLTAPKGVVFSAMAQDSGGNLYVGAYQSTDVLTQEILVYAPGASGAATPERTISGTSTQLSTKGVSLPEDQLNGILALAVDGTGQVYATAGPSILVFAAGADGNVAPTRVLSAVTYVTALAVDSAGDLLAANVSSDLSIGDALEFSATANGNAAPTHTYGGAEMSFAFGLDVDGKDDVYVSDTTGGGKIYEYSPDGTSPMRTFTTAASAGGGSYESFWGLREDTSGYTFVAVQLSSDMTGIQVFSPTSSGDSACVTFATTTPFVREPQILLR